MTADDDCRLARGLLARSRNPVLRGGRQKRIEKEFARLWKKSTGFLLLEVVDGWPVDRRFH